MVADILKAFYENKIITFLCLAEQDFQPVVFGSNSVMVKTKNTKLTTLVCGFSNKKLEIQNDLVRGIKF